MTINRGEHFVGCGCVSCAPRAAIVNVTAQEHFKGTVERQLQELLRQAELEDSDVKDWFGGLEITDPPRDNYYGCSHHNPRTKVPQYTRYAHVVQLALGPLEIERFYCHRCGRILTNEPVKPT